MTAHLNVNREPVNDENPVPTSGTAAHIYDRPEEVTGLPSVARSVLAPGDFMQFVKTGNGEVITQLSISPFEHGESSITLNVLAGAKNKTLHFEGSLNQRARGVYAAIEMFGQSQMPPEVLDYEIESMYQSTADNGVAYNAAVGAIMHVRLKVPLPAKYSLGRWVDVTGFLDTRANVANGMISYIRRDRKLIEITFPDHVTMSNLALSITPPDGTAFMRIQKDFGGSRNGVGMLLTQQADRAVLMSRFGGAESAVFGTVAGDQRSAILSSAPIYDMGIDGEWSIRANRYIIDITRKSVEWLDAAGSSNAVFTSRAVRTGVLPNGKEPLQPRVRVRKSPSMTRPVAKIVSATHATASNVTTLVLDEWPDEGLAVGNFVAPRNVSNQVQFINNAAGAAITACDEVAKTVTLLWGPATAGVGYGGSLILQHGAVDQPGMLGQVVGSVLVDPVTGDLQLTSLSGNWAGFGGIGEQLELHGIRSSVNGEDIGIDGTWELAFANTTILRVRAVFAADGTRISPVLPPVLNATPCGGSVMLRTVLRINNLGVICHDDNVMQLKGQGTASWLHSLPVNVLGGNITATISGTPPVTANEGTQAAGTNYNLTTTASLNPASIKSSAGNLTEITISNPTATPGFLKIYNKATAPQTSDVPLLIIPAPANSFVPAPNFGRYGKRFSAGIAIGFTANMPANDNVNAVAGVLISATYV
jgi:hypothetical protein